MQAVVITRPGGPEVLAQEERPTPEPGPGEIRVRVRASALNRADLLQRRGGYPAPQGAPADIPGLEYAGEVDATGEGAGLWGIGNRVMGITAGGAHAEFVVVNEREAIRVPQQLSLEQAAATPEVFLTAYDALFNRLHLQRGERLLIHAVGSGVGTAALQLARAHGAVVLGTSRTAAKLERATEWGLTTPIDTTAEDLADSVRRATDGAGVDAVLDLVGGPMVETGVQLLAPRGRLVVVGLVGGTTAQLDLGLLLRKRLEIVGTVLRSRSLEEKVMLAREFSRDVLPLLTSGEVRPVIDRMMRFSEIADAHRAMEANETFGKIVLTW